MAKKIYLGRMLESVQTDLATMSSDMASMVTELIALKDAMGQSIETVNVKSGDTKEIVLNAAELSAVYGTDTTIATFKCRCSGFIKITGSHRAAVATKISRVKYSLNGAADVLISTNTTISYVAFSQNLAVNVNDVVVLKLESGSSGQTVYFDAGGAVKYELIDLVNDGAVIIQ